MKVECKKQNNSKLAYRPNRRVAEITRRGIISARNLKERENKKSRKEKHAMMRVCYSIEPPMGKGFTFWVSEKVSILTTGGVFPGSGPEMSAFPLGLLGGYPSAPSGPLMANPMNAFGARNSNFLPNQYSNNGASPRGPSTTVKLEWDLLYNRFLSPLSSGLQPSVSIATCM